MTTDASPTPHEAPLRHGWEPDTPVDDTLLRRYLFHWAAYCAAYAEAAGGVTLRTDTFAAADLRRPAGYFNSVTLLQPPGEDVDAVLDGIDDFLADGVGEVLLWSAWPTGDLSPRGWHLEGHPPLLARPPASVLPPPTPGAADIRRVTSAAELADWERVAIEGYPMPGLEDIRPGELAHPALLDDDRFGFWVGRDDDDRAVSLGTSFVDHGIGSFALGVTRPEARRQGHWLGHAAARLAHMPHVWVTGVFSDHSRPGAESIGFVPLLRLTLWSRAR